MKAIYINLDAYLAPLVAWIKAGKVGDAPKFSPLPLAVSVGLGESVGVFAQSGAVPGAVASVAWSFSPSLGDAIASGVSLGLSRVLASESASVYAVTGDAFTATATITDVSSPTADTYAIAFPVVVNRAAVQGPVDLVDYTPPASAPSAADINSALVAAGSGALSGVSLAGAVLNGGESITTDMSVDGLSPFAVDSGSTILSVIGYVTQS